MNIQNEIINSRWLFSSSMALQSYEPFVNAIFNQKLTAEEKREYIKERDDKFKVRYFAFSNNRATEVQANTESEMNKYAMIQVEGAITKNDGLCSKGTDTMRKELENAGKDASVNGVILNINSPGGSVWGTEGFADAIKNFSTKFNKPIASYVDGMACSAAYWIGSNADSVFLSGRTSEVGCVGTRITLRDQRERLAAMGVKEVDVNASKSFNKNGVYEEAINGNTTPLQTELLDPINEVFLDSVKAARGAKLSQKTIMSNGVVVEDALSGKTFIGEAAIAAGLADSIGDLNDVVAHLDSEYSKMSAQKIDALKAKINFKNQNNKSMNFKDVISSMFKSMGIVSAVTTEGNTLTLEQLEQALPTGDFVSQSDFEAMVSDLKASFPNTDLVSEMVNSSKFDATELNAKIEALEASLKEVATIVADSKNTTTATAASTNGTSSMTAGVSEIEMTWATFEPVNGPERQYKALGNENPHKQAMYLKEVAKLRKHK